MFQWSKSCFMAVPLALLISLAGMLTRATDGAKAQFVQRPYPPPPVPDTQTRGQFNAPLGNLQTPNVPPPLGSPGMPDNWGTAQPDRSPPPDPPPPASPAARKFIIVACSHAIDGSAECQHDVANAAGSLADALAEEIVSGIVEKEMKLQFPSAFDKADQIRIIQKIEQVALATMELTLNNQLKQVAAFKVNQLSAAEAQLAIAQHVAAVNRINQQAREQANTGENWDHNWQRNTHWFRFQSNAYNQAHQIVISGWGSN